MHPYTMTFVDADQKGLAFDVLQSEGDVSQTIVERLKVGKLILADFNWEGFYDPKHSLAYLEAPYHCSAVVEIHLELDTDTLGSRSTIYQHCLSALQKGQLAVVHSDSKKGTYTSQRLIRLDMSA